MSERKLKVCYTVTEKEFKERVWLICEHQEVCTVKEVKIQDRDFLKYINTKVFVEVESKGGEK